MKEEIKKVMTQLHTSPVRNLTQYKLGKFIVLCSPVHCAQPHLFMYTKGMKIILNKSYV
jgi:hypothetical protein